jgi:hypothetical protein
MKSQKTKEERAAYDKVYRTTHRKERVAYIKVYNAAHRGKISAYQKLYRVTHREKLAPYHKNYRDAHKEEMAAWRLLHKYGLSKPDFDVLLNSQGGVCAICKKADWNRRGPYVDHDHATGKVRGILCNKCNTALAMIGDDVKILKAIGDYLKKPSIRRKHGR